VLTTEFLRRCFWEQSRLHQTENSGVAFL